MNADKLAYLAAEFDEEQRKHAAATKEMRRAGDRSSDLLEAIGEEIGSFKKGQKVLWRGWNSNTRAIITGITAMRDSANVWHPLYYLVKATKDWKEYRGVRQWLPMSNESKLTAV